MTTSAGERATVGVPFPTYPPSAEPLSTRKTQPEPRLFAWGRVRAVRPPDVFAGALGSVADLLCDCDGLSDGDGVVATDAGADDETDGAELEAAAVAAGRGLSGEVRASAAMRPTATAPTKAAPTTRPRRADAEPEFRG